MSVVRALVVLFLALSAAACGRASLLSQVTVEPSAITPNQDGNADVARIGYRVGVPALVTIELVGADGRVHTLRQSLPRAPGQHEAMFGGVVGDRMLADGVYTVTVSAVPRGSGSQQAVEERALAIGGADTVAPVLAGFAVHPAAFSPNQDGIADRVSIGYRLDERADVRLWLETADGQYVTDILEEQESAKTPGQVGAHVYDFDAGVDADAPPPPDGDYLVVAEARDAAGNVSMQRLPLTIMDGGQPRAAIVSDVEWSDSLIPLGGTLSFTATVVNVGDTPIRTRGPEPGFRYDNDQTFNLYAPPGWLLWIRKDDRTVSRRIAPSDRPTDTVAVDLGDAVTETYASAEPLGASHPADAEPTSGTRQTLCGSVVDGGRPVEGARVVVFETDGDNGVETTTDGSGRFCVEGLRPPDPSQRTFARSPGAIRLGLAYDDLGTDVEYPFRWQLGRPDQLDACVSGDVVYLCLPPGRSVPVTGRVRFVEPPFRRTTAAFVALMHEDVRKMQGPYGREALTIEY